jgi:hypothetical protein
MAFRTGGVGEAMRIDSAGRVGIDTSTPEAKLQIGASSFATKMDGNNITFTRNFRNYIEALTPGGSIICRSDSYQAFEVGGSEIARFDNSGFSIRDTQGDDDVRMTLYPNGSTYSQLGASSTISFIDSGGARPFVVYTNGSERSRMTENGALLIGTSVPGASKLVVNDDSIQINTAKTPASASDTGTTGQIAWDDDHIYVCTATDTWVRAGLATW